MNIEPEIIIFLAILLGIALFLNVIQFRKRKQLSHKNQLLAALRKLDEVALAGNDLKTICQDIVDVIRKELGYFFGVIALVDQRAGGIRRMAISADPLVDSILPTLPVNYYEQVVPFTVADNLLVRSFLEKRAYYSANLYDVQKGVLSEKVSKEIQTKMGIKALYIYPLLTSNEVIGVIYYAPQIGKEKISRLEFDAMVSFRNEVSRILDNILLYHNLRRTSEALLGANQQLRELDKLKDDFVSVVSHELRTPMTAIRSYAWMALHRADVPLSKNLEKYIARILISTERLINLVNDMLNVSRIESGKIEINPEPVDLISLAKDIIDELYYSKSSEKMVEFVILEKQIPKVLADPEKLRQIFLNLVGNSLKFTPDGGKIIFDFFTDGKVVETSLSDTGVGMSKEDLSKLFNKFQRLDNSYTAAATSGGTGLGLYISKNLIELMHGKIWANSEGLNKGSVFTVALPIASDANIKNIELFRVKPEGEAKALEPVAL